MVKAKKEAASGVVVRPEDLIVEDAFVHAQRVMGEKNFNEAMAAGRELTAGIRLQKLREFSGKTQSQVKGFGQENISQIENRGDVRLSTYKKVIEGLGYDYVAVAIPRQGSVKKNTSVVMLEGESALIDGLFSFKQNTLVFDKAIKHILGQALGSLEKTLDERKIQKKAKATVKPAVSMRYAAKKRV